MASRRAFTVAPDGSHWERKANGWGNSGGATAPPDDAFPRITKNDQDGTIAQGPRTTAIREANDATARTCTAIANRQLVLITGNELVTPVITYVNRGGGESGPSSVS